MNLKNSTKFGLIIALLGLLLSFLITRNTNTQNNITIELNGTSFTPENIHIKNNQKVIFNNKSNQEMWPASNIHPTHGIYPEFDPQTPIKSNGSWTFQFGKTGTWKYHDHISPSVTGTIVVEE